MKDFIRPKVTVISDVMMSPLRAKSFATLPSGLSHAPELM
jgi:hypothetical protein